MKTAKVVIIVILVIVFIPLIAYAGWLLKKGESLEIFVVNKSMIHFRGSENRAMNAVLDGEKIMTSGNRPYNLKVDQYGLFWNNGRFSNKFPRLRDLDRTVELSDLVYYADSKGIMTSDIRKLKDGEEDKLEFGGLNNTDYTFIRKLISENKPLVVECNFFGPPTEPLIRYNIEQMTDVYYVGWSGKYVNDLAGEADLRPGIDWKVLYKDYTGNEWNFKGPGLVMMNKDAGRILVLEEGRGIHTADGLIVSDAPAAVELDLPEAVNYSGWFTLLHPGQNEVISEFQLNPSEEGKLLLNEFGIPENFPAMIHAEDHLYFLAGDFGKCKSNMVTPKLLVLGPVIDKFKRNSKKSSNFFYSYYQPFMTSLLDEVRTDKAAISNQ